MTLKEASKLLGVGRETLRKAILAGDLPASAVNGPGGRTYTVTSHDIQQWWERWERKEVTLGTPVGTLLGTVGTEEVTLGTSEHALGTLGTPVGTLLGTVGTLGSNPVGTVGSSLGTLGTSEGAMGSLGTPSGDPMGTLVIAHIEAVKNNGRLLEELLNVQRQLETERQAKERAERQAYAMREEMGAYQRALSESAESLAEQRALLAVVEAQHHQVELTHQVQEQANLATLKVDTTTTSRGWGSRLRRFLGVRQTG
jgi:excisionase family DNA binding protein